MATSFHCDRDECDSWQRAGIDGEIPDHWFALSTQTREIERHFCSRDCVMFWAASSKPVDAFEEWD
jgi:hypothetical protein